MLAWTCIRHALSFGANIFKRHNSVTVSGLRPPLPALAARCYQKLDAIKGGSFFFGAFFFGLRRDTLLPLVAKRRAAPRAPTQGPILSLFSPPFFRSSRRRVWRRRSAGYHYSVENAGK